MDKTKNKQKKSTMMSYIYAGIVAVLVVACAVTIALVNANKTTPVPETNIGEDVVVDVATKPTFVSPMKDATIAKDYSASELQYNETLKQWEIHKAIDFVAGEDLNVYAISAGTVSNVYTNYLEGTVVEISHQDGLISVYKSLNEDVSVAVGAKVSAGTVIGQVAESMAEELNVGAHLHFEMLKNNSKVNPNDYLDLGNK